MSLSSHKPYASDRLTEILRRQILDGELSPGVRIASVRDLARRYDASTVTVQKAVARLCDEGLVKSVRGSGTYICELRKESETKTVALMMDCRGHVFSHITDELVRRLQGKNYQLVMMSRDPQRGIEQFSGIFSQWVMNPPHAVVLQWHSPDLDDAIALASDGRSRVITTWRSLDLAAAEGWMRVQHDTMAVAREVVAYAKARGHRRIGYVTHGRIIDAAHPHNLRKLTTGHTEQLLALGRALREAGIEKNGLSIYYYKHGSDYYMSADGNLPMLAPDDLEGVLAWLSRPTPPTLLFGEDPKLAQIIHSFRCSGSSLAESVDVLGLANTPWSQAFGFSSISINEPLIAAKMAELIEASDEQLRGVSLDLRVLPQLVER